MNRSTNRTFTKTKNYDYDSNEDESDEEVIKRKREIKNISQTSPNNDNNSDEDKKFWKNARRGDRDSTIKGSKKSLNLRLASNKSLKQTAELANRLTSNKSLNPVPKLNTLKVSQLVEIREMAQNTKRQRTMSIDSSDDSIYQRNKKLPLFDDKINNNYIERNNTGLGTFIHKNSTNIIPDSDKLADYQPILISNDKVYYSYIVSSRLCYTSSKNRR